MDPSTGSVSTDSLATDTWYDRRGQAVKVAGPGGLVEKYAFDGAGRAAATYTTDGGGDSSWADALTVTGDKVLEQVETEYDAAGNAVLAVTRQRFHDETGTGALGDPSTAPKARVSYQGMYYDAADRLTAAVDVGTNGGSAWARPGAVPSRSDTVPVTSRTYNSAGWVEEVTDPKGVKTRTEYDDLGRVVRSIEHYTDGTVTDTSNKTVEYTYAGPGLRKTLTARLTGGGVQTTEWVYGVTTAGGSGLNSNEVLGAVEHPDPSTGAASASEQETLTVSALGQTVTRTDRNGTVHTYAYDVLGRQVSDAVTALGSGVDGAVRRIETACDGQGNAYLFTSYDAATGGTIVNQVLREFNGPVILKRKFVPKGYEAVICGALMPDPKSPHFEADNAQRLHTLEDVVNTCRRNGVKILCFLPTSGFAVDENNWIWWTSDPAPGDGDRYEKYPSWGCPREEAGTHYWFGGRSCSLDRSCYSSPCRGAEGAGRGASE